MYKNLSFIFISLSHLMQCADSDSHISPQDYLPMSAAFMAKCVLAGEAESKVPYISVATTIAQQLTVAPEKRVSCYYTPSENQAIIGNKLIDTRPEEYFSSLKESISHATIVALYTAEIVAETPQSIVVNLRQRPHRPPIQVHAAMFTSDSQEATAMCIRPEHRMVCYSSKKEGHIREYCFTSHGKALHVAPPPYPEKDLLIQAYKHKPQEDSGPSKEFPKVNISFSLFPAKP